jgi:cyclic pyranopterin monophosphate synthase
MKKLTHINQKGDAQLVDITDKAITHRKAIAEGTIQLNKETLKLIQANLIKKGDVLNTAKIAGIQAAKKLGSLFLFVIQSTLLKLILTLRLIKKIIRLFVNHLVNVLRKQGLKWRLFQPSSSPSSPFMTW